VSEHPGCGRLADDLRGAYLTLRMAQHLRPPITRFTHSPGSLLRLCPARLHRYQP